VAIQPKNINFQEAGLEAFNLTRTPLWAGTLTKALDESWGQVFTSELQTSVKILPRISARISVGGISMVSSSVVVQW
jgi:hypothetical protein